MRISIRIVAGVALLWSTAAPAEQACVSRQQIAAMATVFVPVALRASREKCAAVLPETAYLRSQESQARLTKADEAAVAAQQGAMDGFKMIAGKDIPEGVSDRTMLTMMSEMAVGELNKKLNPSTCAALDEVFVSTRSMSGPDVGTLIGTLMAFTIGGGSRKPPICKI